MSKKQGFSIIELLVVIAIVGILSSVVMSAVNGARAKAIDASLKANMHTVQTQAQIFYDGAYPNSYNGMCNDAIVLSAYNQAIANGGTGIGYSGPGGGPLPSICNATSSYGYLVAVAIKSAPTTYWCVDASGFVGVMTNTAGGTQMSAPERLGTCK